MVVNRIFEQPQRRSRDELSRDLASDDPIRIATAITAAALYDTDRIFVESLIERLLKHPDPCVRGAAAIAAGHVARIHGTLTRDPIISLIEGLLSDARTRGKAQDALDDIRMFVDSRQ